MKSVDWLMSAVTKALGLLLIGGVALNCVNAGLRYALGDGLVWAEEVMAFGMIFIIMMGAVVSTSRDEHLRMDLLLQLLPPAAKRSLRILSHALLATVCGYLAMHSYVVVELMFRLDQISVAARMPVWIPHSFVLASFALCSLLGALALLRELLPQGGMATICKEQHA